MSTQIGHKVTVMEESTSTSPASTGIKKNLSRRILLLVLIGLVVFAWGFNREPADSTKPIAFHGTPQYVTLPKHTIRVGTFNIHAGKGLDGVRDLGRTSQLMRGLNLDLVIMQEVLTRSFRIARDQADVIGNELQMASLFVPAERRWWHNSYGNAVLTRIGSTGFHRLPLITTKWRKFRTAILFNVPHEGRIIHFLMVHLDKGDEGRHQLDSICDLFLSLSEPAVLLGDLNTKKDVPRLKALLAESSVTDFITDGIRDCPKGKGVDWIIARGLRFAKFGSVVNDVSDHPLVWAEMELSTSPQTTDALAIKAQWLQNASREVDSVKR